VTVRLADEFGNPILGAEDTLVAETMHNLGDGSITEFRPATVEGEYSAVITSSEEGQKAIAVTLDGTEMTADGNDTASFSGDLWTLALASTGLALTGALVVATMMTVLGACALLIRSRRRAREQ
jgi:hypothetical protein